jgi:DNA-binding response OmpR family regulator
VSITATDIAMPALGGRRVLVVESRADDAAALAAMLRLKGFDARTARTGADALAAAAAHPPQVVVLDLDLPDADGCELIRRLRARPDPPAVAVVTGHTGPAVRREAAAAGAAAYLLKPAEPDQLAALVGRLCRTGD